MGMRNATGKACRCLIGTADAVDFHARNEWTWQPAPPSREMAGESLVKAYLLVFLGAGMGGMMRHAVNAGAARLLGYGFPAGTMIVNVAGSFLMGALAGYFALKTGLPQSLRLFLTTGVLGGFTTFSAFSLDAALLIERNAYGQAAGYVLGSLFLSLAGLFAGLALFQGQANLP